MKLRVLNYFLAVAREQSMIRAAESLHLSQPTLSTQIKNMEEELGKQLFFRSSKGSRKVTLTEEGMILKKRAEEILDLVRKAEHEIALSDAVIMGDIYIGTGETEAMKPIARAAKKLQADYPEIHFHITSGNSIFVREKLDKGLIDFGVVYGTADLTRYHMMKIPEQNSWGVLMRRDSPLAEKSVIRPKDLKHQPLILSQQEIPGGELADWLSCNVSELNIVATYNLIYNGSLLAEAGLGYVVGFDKIINTSGDSSLCFRPLEPALENEMCLIWKKYQVFSKPCEKFLSVLRETLGAEDDW